MEFPFFVPCKIKLSLIMLTNADCCIGRSHVCSLDGIYIAENMIQFTCVYAMTVLNFKYLLVNSKIDYGAANVAKLLCTDLNSLTA